MRVHRKRPPWLLYSCAGCLGVALVLIVFFPLVFVVIVYSLLFLPASIPYGINDDDKLMRNFQEQRPALEAIVSAVRMEELTVAELGFLGLTVREQPELQEDGQLRRAMRRARIQRFEVISRRPLIVELVTDEAPTVIDIHAHGYRYTEDSDERNRDFYNGNNRLHRNWYLFEHEL